MDLEISFKFEGAKLVYYLNKPIARTKIISAISQRKSMISAYLVNFMSFNVRYPNPLKSLLNEPEQERNEIFQFFFFYKIRVSRISKSVTL